MWGFCETRFEDIKDNCQKWNGAVRAKNIFKVIHSLKLC